MTLRDLLFLVNLGLVSMHVYVCSSIIAKHRNHLTKMGWIIIIDFMNRNFVPSGSIEPLVPGELSIERSHLDPTEASAIGRATLEAVTRLPNYQPFPASSSRHK